MLDGRAPGLSRRALLGLAALGLQQVACGASNDNQRVNLPNPTEKSTIGPGDVFTMEVVGEKELPREYQVASDGTVDLPFVQTVHVVGLEPQEIARLIRK